MFILQQTIRTSMIFLRLRSKMTKKVRLFIKNLPEKASEDEIKAKFSDYGKIVDVKVQERKNLNPVFAHSRYFAYVNVKTDDHKLQKCFADFNKNLWHNEHVELQMAKENFLDVLKRERETCNKSENLVQNEASNKSATHTRSEKAKTLSCSNECNEDFQPKIESKDKADKSQSEMKRINSINQMVKEYQLQKAAVKTALSSISIDSKPNKKIIFDEEIDESTTKTFNGNTTYLSNKKNKNRTLFEEDDDDDDAEDNYNFEVKEIFEGKKGKELYELQSKYKNDKRFMLDERFKNDEEDERSIEKERDETNSEEITIEEEKQRQYKILEQVLGSKPKHKESNQNKGTMLRFDPTHSEHRKYEMQKEKRVTKVERNERVEINERREEEQPKVSKEVFYQVKDDLKEALQKEQGFSLLNLFGNADKREVEDLEQKEESAIDINKKSNFDTEPFNYDSSASEEFVETPNADTAGTSKETAPSKFWHETFFFKDDDYRLQEGCDFVKRMASENKDEFTEVRKKLKEIVKTKVRHNQRRNKPFKKKLGGAKRKKMIRIKKAMKR